MLFLTRAKPDVAFVTKGDIIFSFNLLTVGRVIERFPVYVIPTEASEKVGLRGPLQVVTYQLHVGVGRVGDKDCIVIWPVSVVRQYRLEAWQKHSQGISSFLFGDSSSSGSKAKHLSLVTIEVGR